VARPELQKLIENLRKGDSVIVARLDRLARSTKNLLEITDKLNEIGAGFRSLAETWAYTTTPAGRMVMTVFAGIAEFERSPIIDRTKKGRIEAKARGVKFGRPPALSQSQINHAQELFDKGKTATEIAELFGVDRSTVSRALKYNGIETHSCLNFWCGLGGVLSEASKEVARGGDI
jgi:DNA invertase Pin-like site-specific DNA recombinase